MEDGGERSRRDEVGMGSKRMPRPDTIIENMKVKSSETMDKCKMEELGNRFGSRHADKVSR